MIDFSKYCNNYVTQEELVRSISSLLNISQQKVLDNIELFSNIHLHLKNIFYYLSQMEGEQMLINASHAMEFLLLSHNDST